MLKYSNFWAELLDAVGPLVDYECPQEITYTMSAGVLKLSCDHGTFPLIMDMNQRARVESLWSSFGAYKNLICRLSKDGKQDFNVFTADELFVHFYGDTTYGIILHASPDSEWIKVWAKDFFGKSKYSDALADAILVQIGDHLQGCS